MIQELKAVVSEEIGETDKSEQRKPPRNTAILGAFRAFNRTIGREKAAKKKAETDHQRNERTVANWSRRVGLFTAILAITSIFGNWVIYKQLLEMQSSGEDTKALVKAAQDSAKAAQDAVAVTKDTAQRQLRAYVVFDRVSLALKDNKINGAIIFKNTGQTPAYQINLDSHFFFGDEGGSVTKLNPTEEVNGTSKLTLGSNMTATVAFFVDVSNYISTIRDPKKAIIIYGSVTYKDVFGQPHHLRFKGERTRIEGQYWIMETAADGNDSD